MQSGILSRFFQSTDPLIQGRKIAGTITAGGGRRLLHFATQCGHLLAQVSKGAVITRGRDRGFTLGPDTVGSEKRSPTQGQKAANDTGRKKRTETGAA